MGDNRRGYDKANGLPNPIWVYRCDGSTNRSLVLLVYAVIRFLIKEEKFHEKQSRNFRQQRLPIVGCE